MSNYMIEGQTLTDIADAIRAKTGSSDPITGANMATEIENIPTGGVAYVGFGKSTVLNTTSD